jgi:uncharacterized protein
VIYLDASALVKLAITEAETPALRAYLEEHATRPRITTALATVEVPRAVMRSSPTALLQAFQAVARVHKVAVSMHVLSTAAALQPPALRSLDAIHLASALTLRAELEAFVAYDERLLAAAEAAGLPAIQPT